MSDKMSTGNPFIDVWFDSQQQMLKNHYQWMFEDNDARDKQDEEFSSVSDFIEKAKNSWQKYEEQFNSWMQAAESWLTPTQEGEHEDRTRAEFEKLTSMLSPDNFMKTGLVEINQVFQKLVDGPDFADIGVIEKNMLKTSRDWAAMRDASVEYQSVIAEAWSRAFTSFSGELADVPMEELSVKPKELLLRWLKIANDQLTQLQRSDEFLDAQRKLFNTSTQYKLKQREMVQLWCESQTIPTRSEVDDLHKIVYGLRREVRQLKTQLSALQTNNEHGVKSHHSPTSPKRSAVKQRKPQE